MDYDVADRLENEGESGEKLQWNLHKADTL